MKTKVTAFNRIQAANYKSFGRHDTTFKDGGRVLMTLYKPDITPNNKVELNISTAQLSMDDLGEYIKVLQEIHAFGKSQSK